MKKILLCLVILLITGCNTKQELVKEKQDLEDKLNNLKEEKENLDSAIEKHNEPKYIDNNNVKISLFLYDNNYHNKERLEDTYYTNFISGQDIGSFEVFLTEDRVVDGTNFKNTWNTYYNKYQDISNHKIGFNIKFILSDGTNYSSNYLKPDTYKYGDYFYTYLYDDINQKDGAYYSHIENMTENTLLTSIKIYGTSGIDKVENIILSAFTYDTEDDFDEEGNYRGNSIYVIRIKRK